MPRRDQSADDHIEETISAWRRERPGLDLSGMAVVARLLRVAHRFDEAQDEFFSALGLKPGWLDVLAALRRSGEPYRLTPTKLAEEALISTAGMTNRLDRLEQAGLVERLPDPDDRRGVLVELTGEGLRARGFGRRRAPRLEQAPPRWTGGAASRRSSTACSRSSSARSTAARRPRPRAYSQPGVWPQGAAAPRPTPSESAARSHALRKVSGATSRGAVS